MRVAITGGIAEGKTTVLGYLQQMGHAVDSADRIAREVFGLAEIQAAVAQLLGVVEPVQPAVLRSRLADPAIRRAVNALTHPPILERIQASPAQFMEVPLLIETCLQGEFDRVWVITCGKDDQMKRLAARLGSEDAALAIVRTQLTSRAKIPFADVVIRTNEPEISVKRSVTLAVHRDLQ